MKADTLTVPPKDIGFKHFVALVAALMATNALAIDTMLPALDVIGDALHIPTANGRQWIVTSYLLGFGGAQLIYGPLSDRFGRRPILFIGLAISIVCSVLAGFATSFEMLVVARVVQGVGAAATRVLAVTIVRDRFSGRQMARVMSLAFIVFLGVPMLAPLIGQTILLFAPWPWIFACLAIFTSVVFLWTAISLPETLHPEDRRPLSFESLLAASRVIATDRVAVGYIVAVTFTQAVPVAYITSAQQLFDDVFGVRALFPFIFAGIVVILALASLLNARIVDRIGTRIVSHSALMAFIGLSVVHVLTVFTGHEGLVTFCLLQAATMGCIGLMTANFNAMAMEPLGHMAGTASSILGFSSTFGGALLGSLVGQHLDGTTQPLAFGYVAFGLLMLLAVAFAEKGRLFHPTIDPSGP
jgi:DHA1 family bicyclomycin/chloramphenicol resistance-like MFS transporter